MRHRFPRRRHGVSLITLMLGMFVVLLSGMPPAVAAAGSEARPATGETGRGRPGLSVLVPVAPYAFVVDRITGGAADVTILVPPGQSPHTYSPAPQHIAAMAEADVLFRGGLPLEDGLIPRLIGLNPTMRIIDLRPGHSGDSMQDAARRHDRDMEGDPEPATADHHDHDDHDPHVWLNPDTVADQAAHIARALTDADPGRSEAYAAGLYSLQRELAVVKDRIAARLAPRSGARFYVFHPAFGHFAEAYGLEQVAVEFEGKEPTAKRLAGLIDRAREEGVRVILVQPQFSDAAARTLAREIDARIVSVDPLAYELFETLRSLAAAIAPDEEIPTP